MYWREHIFENPICLLNHCFLSPLAPVVEILEAAVDKYYERNSTLELGCRVRHLPTTAVNWLHQARVLNDDTQRGGIRLVCIYYGKIETFYLYDKIPSFIMPEQQLEKYTQSILSTTKNFNFNGILPTLSYRCKTKMKQISKAQSCHVNSFMVP